MYYFALGDSKPLNISFHPGGRGEYDIVGRLSKKLVESFFCIEVITSSKFIFDVFFLRKVFMLPDLEPRGPKLPTDYVLVLLLFLLTERPRSYGPLRFNLEGEGG